MLRPNLAEKPGCELACSFNVRFLRRLMPKALPDLLLVRPIREAQLLLMPSLRMLPKFAIGGEGIGTQWTREAFACELLSILKLPYHESRLVAHVLVSLASYDVRLDLFICTAD